jgi:hypothetical protein
MKHTARDPRKGFPTQKKQIISLSVLLLSLTAGTDLALADIGDDLSSINSKIEDALKIGADGAIRAEARYRFENMNQDNTVSTTTGKPVATSSQPKTANANTVRTKLGILTPTFYGVQGYVEYLGVHPLSENYSPGYNTNLGAKSQFSNIPDPNTNRLNQLWLSYSGIPDTVIKGGRQTFLFDDRRFVGESPWRQTETVFDSVLVTNKSIKNLTAKIAYIGNVNTTLATNDNMNTPLLNLNYSFSEYGNLVGYGYWIGYTKPPATSLNPNTSANRSNQTYGLRFVNSDKPKTFFDHYNLLYTAEWAIQKDYLNSPVKYQASRYNFMAGANIYDFLTVKGNFEQMDGHGTNQSFVTPIGATHGINGWADIFGATPAYGLRQWTATTVATFLDDKSLELTGIFRDFSSSSGKINYGKEWDFQALKKFGPHYSIAAIYTYFDAAHPTPNYVPVAGLTNTQKVFVQATINF